MSLVKRNEGNVSIVKFEDERILDELKIQHLGQQLIALTQDSNITNLVLNFENVEFMSSAMIGKLVLLNKKCGATNKPLRFCCINGDVMEVFKLTNLDKVFAIDNNEAASLSYF